MRPTINTELHAQFLETLIQPIMSFFFVYIFYELLLVCVCVFGLLRACVSLC